MHRSSNCKSQAGVVLVNLPTAALDYLVPFGGLRLQLGCT
jgi:hypothetical protein